MHTSGQPLSLTLRIAIGASEGRIGTDLREWRRLGLTYDEISRRLNEQEVPVTREAVRSWCNQLGIVKGEKVPA
jgi:hypothetical protein